MRAVTNPKLLDVCLKEIADTLESKLRWLDNAFGKAERIIKGINQDPIQGDSPYFQNAFPGIYKGYDDEYLNLFPSDDEGNFSFFLVKGSQPIEAERFGPSMFNYRVQLVVWWDYRNLFGDNHQDYSIEHVKHDVFTVLNNSSFTNVRSFAIAGFEERVNKIYEDFKQSEVQNQFAIRPYGVLGIDLEIGFTQLCNYTDLVLPAYPPVPGDIDLGDIPLSNDFIQLSLPVNLKYGLPNDAVQSSAEIRHQNSLEVSLEVGNNPLEFSGGEFNWTITALDPITNQSIGTFTVSGTSVEEE